MRPEVSVSIAVGVGLCLYSPCGKANLLKDGSFESPMITGAQGFSAGSTLGDWNVVDKFGGQSSVALVNNNYTETAQDGGTLYFHSQDGSQNVDLTGVGNTGTPGLQQTVGTTPGSSYTLSFYVGNQDNSQPNYSTASSVELDINGTFINIYTNNDNSHNDVNWQQIAYSFTASSASTTIDFYNATSGDNYAGLDNVDLEQAGAVPAPVIGRGLPVLLAAGSILVGARLLKHRKRGH
jgi:hypothetical protein